MSYLDLLDEMLGDGLRALGEQFPRAQLAYVLGRQQPDGGWGGRRGGSDPYYTEFALRLVTLLSALYERLPAASAPPSARGWKPLVQPDLEPVLAAAADYLTGRASPSELVDVFSLLNARRLLAKHGVALDVDEGACRDEIGSRRARRGGYGRQDGSVPTAYATFLGALSLSLLGDELPHADQAVAAISALQQPDGGFAQEPDGTSQVNSTAASVAFLLMENALSPDQAEHAVSFLAARQDASGGFSSHPGAPADLLATFTALSTLAFLDGLKQANCGALARFVRSCASADGGFGAHPADGETDVEYTYYGVGALALLGLIAQ